MARMNRTQTSLQSSNNGMPSVGLQRFNQVVPKVGGASDGVNPFAGDLSSAFNNFFGQISKAASTLQEADFAIRKQEAQVVAEKWRQDGLATANREFQKNPNITAQEAESRLTPEQKDNNNFLLTFRKAMGANVGDKIYSDFRIHMANVDPAKYETEASDWWQKKFAGGTGDPTVDASMQAQWMRNYEQDRVTFAGEAIKAVRQNTTNEIIKNVGPRINSADFGVADITAIQTQFQSLFNGESAGQNMARALTALKIAAVPLGRTATQRFIAALHAPMPTDNPDETTSIAEQFPAQVAAVEQETTAALESYVTLSGQQALTKASTEFASILASNPDKLAQFDALTNWRLTTMPNLANTPGVGSGYSQLDDKVIGKLAELSAYKLAQNRMGAFVANPTEGIPGFDRTEFQKYGEDFMTRNFNPFTGKQGVPDEVVAMQAGQFLSAGISRFGLDGITKEVREQFGAALLSADTATSARAAHALKMIDGNGRIGAMLLDGNARALSKFQHMTQGNATVPYGTLQSRAGTFDVNVADTTADITKAGGVRKFLFSSEGTATKIDAKWQSEFRGSSMAEALDEVLGDTWGTPNVAEPVLARVEEMVGVVVARRAAEGLDISDYSAIRKEVALNLKNSIVISDGVIKMVREAPEVRLNEQGTAVSVPIGNSVMNPITFAVENTAETLRSDMDAIEAGMANLSIEGETGVSIGYKQSTDHRDVNGQLLTNKDTDTALTIPVGIGMNMQEQFSAGSTDRKGWWSRWGTDTVTFSGNVEKDQELARRYLHPAIQLIPQNAVRMVNGETKEVVIGYQLLLTPRLTGQTKMSLEDLRRSAVKDPRNGAAYIEELNRRQQEMNIAP